MNPHFDAIVVGVGGMGAATCYHLARRGARVLGLEQFDIPHTVGSSHGYSRMIRLAYYEHPDYVPLLRRAYALWDELAAAAGQPVLFRTGGIYMGPPNGHVVSGALRAARQHGLAHEALDRAELARRFPQFALPDDFAGVWEPEAGFLRPELAIAAHALQAMKGGAEIRGHECVKEWRSHGSHVAVTTDRGEYRADRVIFCGGAWSGQLLRELGVKLEVTRQVLGWVWPRRPELFEMGRFPVWGIENPDGSLSYGFPMLKDNPGLKLARHGRGSVMDPDSHRRVTARLDEREVQEILERFLPEGCGPTLALRVCMYTNSPDGHFIIDRLPGQERVLVACGFSGHGFKFASVVGEALAEMALEGRTRHPIGFLGVGRFGREEEHRTSDIEG